MIEWFLSLLLMVPAVTGSAFLLESAYRKLDCERRSFERARRTLELSKPTLENPEGIRIREICGSTSAVVFLPYLENENL